MFQVEHASCFVYLTYTETPGVFAYFLKNLLPMKFKRNGGCCLSNSLLASCWQFPIFCIVSRPMSLRMHCFMHLQVYLWSSRRCPKMCGVVKHQYLALNADSTEFIHLPVMPTTTDSGCTYEVFFILGLF